MDYKKAQRICQILYFGLFYTVFHFFLISIVDYPYNLMLFVVWIGVIGFCVLGSFMEEEEQDPEETLLDIEITRRKEGINNAKK
jgi:hypothetical protein